MGLLSATMTFVMVGICIVPTCCDTGPVFLKTHPEDRPSISRTLRQGVLITYSYPGIYGFFFFCINGSESKTKESDT